MLAYTAEFDITYPNGPDIGTRISDEYQIQDVPEMNPGRRRASGVM